MIFTRMHMTWNELTTGSYEVFSSYHKYVQSANVRSSVDYQIYQMDFFYEILIHSAKTLVTKNSILYTEQKKTKKISRQLTHMLFCLNGLL